MNYKKSLFCKITFVFGLLLITNTVNAGDVPDGFVDNVTDNQTPPTAPIDGNLFLLSVSGLFYAAYRLNKHKNILKIK